jgi:hypothetical protein
MRSRVPAAAGREQHQPAVGVVQRARVPLRRQRAVRAPLNLHDARAAQLFNAQPQPGQFWMMLFKFRSVQDIGRCERVIETKHGPY